MRITATSAGDDGVIRLSEIEAFEASHEEVRGLRMSPSWGAPAHKTEVRGRYVRRDDPDKAAKIAALRRRFGTRAPIGAKRRFRVLERCGFACVYCGRRPPDVVLVVDHIVPVVMGGSSDEDNLAAACRDCNAGKGGTLLAGHAAPVVPEPVWMADGGELALVLASPFPAVTLRTMRKERGVTRRQLAEVWGWGRLAFVRELEEGRRSCPCTPERVAEYLAVLDRATGRSA